MMSQESRISSRYSNGNEKSLRRFEANLFLNCDMLYKMNHNMVLLIYVDKPEVDMLNKEIHEGSFGTHANGHAMARKILRVNYY